MPLAYAICKITLPKGQDPILPGTVKELDDDMYKEMEGLNAVREPTDDEIAIYEQIEAAKASKAPKDAEDAPATKKPATNKPATNKSAAKKPDAKSSDSGEGDEDDDLT